MKSFSRIIVAGFVVLALAAPSALGADRVVSLGAALWTSSSTIDVPVNIDDPSGVYAADFTFASSPSVFTLTNALYETGDLPLGVVPPWSSPTFNSVNGKVSASGVDGVNSLSGTSPGSLFHLLFQVADGTPPGTPVDISIAATLPSGGLNEGTNLQASYRGTSVVVPEPSSWFLMAAGLVTLALAWRRRRRA